jgi:hypothetical protein
MTSLKQRAANRNNSLKSSGPRSEAGKRQSSVNSVKHSLTRPIDALPWGQHLQALMDLLIRDGLMADQARDLARKILDYERNLAYQRERFIDLKNGEPLQYETPPSVLEDVALVVRLDRTKETKTKPIFDEKLDPEMAKFFRTVARRDLQKVHSEALKVLRNADRHLRRSANQLIKSLRTG